MLNRLPLRRQVLATMCLLLLPLLAAMIWAGTTTWGEREAELGQQSEGIAEAVAASLDQYVLGLYGLASTLARHDAVIAVDPERTQRLFASILPEQPLLSNVALRDRNGVLVSTAHTAMPDQVPMLDFVQELFRTGNPVLSDVFTTRVSRTPTAVLAYPVRDAKNSIVAALGLQIDLLRLQNAFSSIPLPPGSVVTVTDRNGRIVVRSVDPEKYVGEIVERPAASGVPVKDVDGVARLSADAVLEQSPWHVTVGIPQSEALWRAAGMWRRNVSVVVTGVAVLVGIALWSAIRLSRRLEGLRTAAQRIASGDLEPPSTTVMPNLELQQVQDAFVTMAARLRDAREAHERQVEQERRMNETLQSMHQQMVRQERLAAVGLLLSGVAHELNNPLQAILGATQLLERRDELSPEIRDEVGFVQIQAIRAREVIRSLSRFTEPHAAAMQAVSLRDVAMELVRLRDHELRDEHVVIAVDAATTRLVRANAGEIARVILNLLLNAEQALLESATVSPSITVRVLDVGPQVRCEVTDNGPGVAAADEPKLLQPFFTTRSIRSGSGLGLSTSYGIIRSYGGTIGYHRNEAGGATFYFELPAFEPEHDAQDRSALLQQSRYSSL